LQRIRFRQMLQRGARQAGGGKGVKIRKAVAALFAQPLGPRHVRAHRARSAPGA
jgi:hypothetical protein